MVDKIMGHVKATESDDWFEVVGTREVETEKAYKILISGNEAVWFPKSQTTLKGTQATNDPDKPLIKLDVKKWLIEDKKLLPFGTEQSAAPAPVPHVDPFPMSVTADPMAGIIDVPQSPAPSPEIDDDIPF
jgi:hypothetical protein